MSQVVPENVTNEHDGTEWIVSPPDELHPFFSGESVQVYSRLVFPPRPEEIRRMLLTMRKELGWSQPFAGAVLGVTPNAVVKWEAGARKPNGSAAKLIFLLYTQMVEKSEKIKNAWDLAFWGGLPCRDSVAEAYIIGQVLEGVHPTYIVPEDEVTFVALGVKKKQAPSTPP